jgi:MFS family permease
MKRNLFPVFALLLGTFFLFLGNGLHGLLLPMRGTIEGYSTTVLGLIGTSWATGFVLGCILAPRLVRRIGHVRAFSGFISMIAIIALLTGILVDDMAWLALRALTGFATAGTSMIIESWLNERATNESRGMIFSFYILITLMGSVGGQMLVPLSDPATPILFMVAGIAYCIAMLPTTLSTAQTPKPLKEVSLDLVSLYRNSPVSFVGILLIGTANGAFGTLGAVFGAKAGLSSSNIAWMMVIPILAGAIMQMPAGRLSDKVDRRYVLAILSGVAWLAGFQLFLIEPAGVITLMILIGVYGAASNALYAIAVAHANDFAKPEDFVKVSGGLLLLYGIGTIIGPTLGGPVMAEFGPYALFAVTSGAHILIVAYAIVRSRLRAAVPVGARGAYSPITTSPLVTQESLALNPRGAGLSDEGDGDYPDGNGREEKAA